MLFLVVGEVQGDDYFQFLFELMPTPFSLYLKYPFIVVVVMVVAARTAIHSLRISTAKKLIHGP